MGEIQTLDEALAYLRPHPSTKGPVILTPEKMREAVGVIQSSLAAERERCAAVADDLSAKAVRMADNQSEQTALRKYYLGRAHAAETAAGRIRNLPPQTATTEQNGRPG